jgi:lipoate-protein ligase A
MRWRLIPLETHNAAMSMALDEALCESVKAGAAPTIRFYRWQPSAVSIGYFQSLEEEVNLGECKALGVDYVRRRTGGGAVYHDYEGEITYSIAAPESFFGDIPASYKSICGCIVDALAVLGIPAEFKPVNDVVTAGKKISGSAQTRRGGVLLQHGTVLYDLDVRRMFSVLRVSAEKISDKMIAAVEERVTCVKKSCNASWQQTYEALVRAFTTGKDICEGAWSEAELARARELAESRYSSREWNFMR